MPDELKGLLSPGEVPLAYELAQQFAQADAVGKDSPTLGSSVSWDSWGLVLPGGPVDVSQRYVDSKLTGLGAGGAQGSLGDLFNQALADSNSDHLLLTSHRFAVTGNVTKRWSLSGTQTILFSVDRRAVVRIARAPRLLQRARIRIDFADGSWAMAMMGMFFTGAAKRLIAAYEQRPA